MSDSAVRFDRTQPDTLAVSGALTFATAARAFGQGVERLAKGDTRVLDLAGVQSADSAGLACVLAWMAHASRHGAPLRVVHLPRGLQLLAAVSDAEPLLGVG
ncbi:STAS domain-containing protein [Oleiagrimonas soli]|uniref:Phospholipid transport system transporter-binding protein n=1 Tax=Oleiagrimonas soli TaxID=1543381 RepID=A0A099CSS7_9GAMM|nr:STAS domain-containing protein [Oleiagrimonas soli]KGI76849.1 hypothetical protein LF63_0113050 [Oleiagrimonas soli]MBB6185296.1 phospholipid transport system transporter-binding protein [Oleiagrimonas soli]